MPQNTAPAFISPWSWHAEAEPGIRIPYQVIRHAVSKSGPVRIQGWELTRVGDVVCMRGVNTRGHALPQFLEVPLTAEVLRRIAMELEAFAAQAEAETWALRQRRRLGTQNARAAGSPDLGSEENIASAKGEDQL